MSCKDCSFESICCILPADKQKELKEILGLVGCCWVCKTEFDICKMILRGDFISCNTLEVLVCAGCGTYMMPGSVCIDHEVYPEEEYQSVCLHCYIQHFLCCGQEGQFRSPEP